MYFDNVAGLGFEPRLTDSESVCLPLADPADIYLAILHQEVSFSEALGRKRRFFWHMPPSLSCLCIWPRAWECQTP